MSSNMMCFNPDIESVGVTGDQDRIIGVSNFPPGTYQLGLKNFFSKFGEVESVLLKSRCWNTKCFDRHATVVFKNSASMARRAWNNNVKILKLRTVYIAGEKKAELYFGAFAASMSEFDMDGFLLYVMRIKNLLPESKGEELFPHVIRAGTLEEYVGVDHGFLTGEREHNINDLNDYCLLHLFSYIDIKDKIKLELVCKRWRIILLDHWKKVTHLDLLNWKNMINLNNCILHRFLQRCGMSLKRLDLCLGFIPSDWWSLKMISSLCRHLTHFGASGLKISYPNLQYLALNCKDLKSITFVFPKNHVEACELLFNNLQLESFCIINCNDPCRFLSKIPQTMKHLEFKNCNNLDILTLCQGLSQAANLKSFKVESCKNVIYFSFGSLSSKHIEELSLSAPLKVFPTEISKYDLDLLVEFKNLRKLHLRKNDFVNDHKITLISQSCRKLEFLDVSGCRCITDVGIKAIAENSTVTSLCMRGLTKVTDVSLISLAKVGKLRKLDCLGCYGITDIGCSRIISSCLNLELLDIRHCNVTCETVHYADKTMILRKDKMLHLIMTERQAKGGGIPLKNRSLKVELTTSLIHPLDEYLPFIIF